LADRIDGLLVSTTISDGNRVLHRGPRRVLPRGRRRRGRPPCSYKDGEPGFVRVLDPSTLAFPNYDGNGLYLSTGNVLVHPNVGLLFIDFERGHRMRLEGTASIDLDDPLLGDSPEVQFVVRVRPRAVYPNCLRYIHRYELVRRSRFVPHDGSLIPVPEWKRSAWEAGALPEHALLGPRRARGPRALSSAGAPTAADARAVRPRGRR
jgi:predicted pyridoxine 5'-phosphate oxidase superfamily flavin-nucleotide-binding protein